MINNCVLIGIAELRTKVDPEQPLEERLKVAMKAALNHWLVTDEESQFKMAVGAVMVEATEEEQERLNIELKFTGALSATTTGIPVDFGRLIEEFGEGSAEKVVGLSKLWDGVRGSNGEKQD